MITRSAMSKIDASSCDTTTIVVPKVSRTWRMSSSSLREVTGSSPADGSSKNTIAGSSARARARPARFFMPPLISAG